MDKQLMIRELVEATDECWHESGMNVLTMQCRKCFAPLPWFGRDSDSVDDLLAIAEKLGLGVKTESQEGHKLVEVYNGYEHSTKMHCINLSDALLSALHDALSFKSIKE